MITAKNKVPVKPEVLFLSLGGIGFLSRFPGTLASIATIFPLFFLSQYNAPFIIFLPILFIMLGVSIFLTNRVQRKFKILDPSWIVIDEFFGIFSLWPFLKPLWSHYLLGFILFRILDIYKPGPIGFVDKKFKGGLGVMLDDILAGILSGITCLIFFKLLNLS